MASFDLGDDLVGFGPGEFACFDLGVEAFEEGEIGRASCRERV